MWRAEWENVYGDVGAVQEAAAVKAGGFKRLFAARAAALKEAEPWQKPSTFEIQASGEAAWIRLAAAVLQLAEWCEAGHFGTHAALVRPACLPQLLPLSV